MGAYDCLGVIVFAHRGLWNREAGHIHLAGRKMTTKQLQELFPNASESFLSVNAVDQRYGPPDGEIPDTKPKRNKKAALVPAVPGKDKGMARIAIRYHGYRCKLLDPENFAGSTKDLTDGLRKAGLIHDDSYWHVTITHEQTQVRSKAEQKTEIEITYP